jgi:hypothetical protein
VAEVVDVLAAGWAIVGKWYFNALALALIAFLIARLLQLDLFQVSMLLWPGLARACCRFLHEGPRMKAPTIMESASGLG